MKTILLLPLLFILAFNSYSQKACDIFTVEDLSKATFLKDADLQVFMEAKGFVLTIDSSSKVQCYTYSINPKSTNTKPQTLILKRNGSRTYLCSPQDAVMLSYVNFLEPYTSIVGVGTEYTTTSYLYHDIYVNIEQYQEKSVKYGRYFIKIEYTASNDQ